MQLQQVSQEIRDQTHLLTHHSDAEEMRFARLLDAASLEERDRLGIAAGTLRDMIAIAEQSSLDSRIIQS